MLVAKGESELVSGEDLHWGEFASWCAGARKLSWRMESDLRSVLNDVDLRLICPSYTPFSYPPQQNPSNE